MGIFSGNPADRATGNVSPGSRAEAGRSTSGMSNGTTRNSSVGSSGRSASSGGGNQGLARDMGDRGFRTSTSGVTAGSMKDQSRLGAAETVNTGAKGGYLGSIADRRSSMSMPSMSTGPVSRGIQKSTVSMPSARMTGIQDYNSIVPGKVTMTAEKIPFGKKNPSLAKYMGGTPAKPVKVAVGVAKKMASTVSKTGAYISSADWFAKQGLPASALTKVGTKTPGYGTTTIQAGPATVGLSYPKTVATGKSFGTYKAGPLASTGPVSRGVQSKSSTGPVSRNVQKSTVSNVSAARTDRAPSSAAASTPKYYDTDYRRDVTEAFRKSPPAKVSPANQPVFVQLVRQVKQRLPLVIQKVLIPTKNLKRDLVYFRTLVL